MLLIFYHILHMRQLQCPTIIRIISALLFINQFTMIEARVDKLLVILIPVSTGALDNVNHEADIIV